MEIKMKKLLSKSPELSAYEYFIRQSEEVEGSGSSVGLSVFIALKNEGLTEHSLCLGVICAENNRGWSVENWGITGAKTTFFFSRGLFYIE